MRKTTFIVLAVVNISVILFLLAVVKIGSDVEKILGIKVRPRRITAPRKPSPQLSKLRII